MLNTRNSILGKIVAVLVMAVIFGSLVTKDKRSDYIEGQELTYEKYLENFEKHKAKVTKEPTAIHKYVLGVGALIIVFVVSYEFLGLLFGYLASLVLGNEPTPAFSGEEETEETIQGVDLTYSMLKANLIALGVSIGIVALLAPIYLAIWGKGNFNPGEDIVPGTVLPFVAVLFLSIVVHEALHGIGFMRFGGAARSDIKYGIMWRCLTPYAHCKVPLPVGSYRWSLLLPGIVLGGLPTIAGLVLGANIIFIYGLAMTVGAGGDLIMVWLLRDADGDALVQDHPTRMGCILLPQEGSS
jgi:hypothetical protein